MAVITVAPDQNVFNRNYKGSTLYTRHNSVLMRKKHITKHYPVNDVIVARRLLKESAITYKNLSDEDKQTWIDYQILHPEYKSSIDFMIKLNIESNIIYETIFHPIESIDPGSTTPTPPTVTILSASRANSNFTFEWSPPVAEGFRFRLFLICTFGAPATPFSSYSIRLDCPADYSPYTLYRYLIPTADYINVKGTLVNLDSIESPFGPVFSYEI